MLMCTVLTSKTQVGWQRYLREIGFRHAKRIQEH